MSQLGEVVKDYDPLMVPTKEVWDKMSEREKHEKEDSIISALEREFNLMGEITMHFNSRVSAHEVLSRYFNDKGKKVFIASDLHTLYPGERAFYPDLMVVFNVESHHRRSWNVMEEGKGLDFVLEILSKETKRKDQFEKLNLYSRLKIPEYFIFDPDHLKIRGYRLSRNNYREIRQENGFCYSQILGLSIKVETDKLRFSNKDGFDIPYANELMLLLNEKLSLKDNVIEGYIKQLEEEKQRAEEAEKREEEEKLRVEKEKLRVEKEKLRAEEAEKREEEEKKRAENAVKEIKRLQELLKSYQ